MTYELKPHPLSVAMVTQVDHCGPVPLSHRYRPDRDCCQEDLPGCMFSRTLGSLYISKAKLLD